MRIETERQTMAELDGLQAEVDALKHLQAETATELDALLPALLEIVNPASAEADARKRLQAETVSQLDALLPVILERVFEGEIVRRRDPL